MTITNRHSTNGHVPVKHEAPPTGGDGVAAPKPRASAGRLLMPALLAVTALIIIRRMQRGSAV